MRTISRSVMLLAFMASMGASALAHDPRLSKLRIRGDAGSLTAHLALPVECVRDAEALAASALEIRADGDLLRPEEVRHATSPDGHEAYLGRWSRQIAARYLDWLGSPNGLDWSAVEGQMLERCARRCHRGRCRLTQGAPISNRRLQEFWANFPSVFGR